MAAAATAAMKVTLTSSDGEKFVVDEEVAMAIINPVIEEVCGDTDIPLPNVTGKILAKVIEYCKKHVEVQKQADEEIKTWDADFVKVDPATLFGLVLAANYLDIKSLLDLTCQTVADMIKGKTPDEIRKTWGLKNDLTPKRRKRFGRRTRGCLGGCWSSPF